VAVLARDPKGWRLHFAVAAFGISAIAISGAQTTKILYGHRSAGTIGRATGAGAQLQRTRATRARAGARHRGRPLGGDQLQANFLASHCQRIKVDADTVPEHDIVAPLEAEPGQAAGERVRVSLQIPIAQDGTGAKAGDGRSMVGLALEGPSGRACKRILHDGVLSLLLG
jgi:hypothetical protein